MRETAWGFGIVFLLSFGFLIWNSYQLPVIFTSETSSTRAVVYNQVPIHKKGYFNSQLLFYKYRDKTSTYYEDYVLKGQSLQIGDSISIEYQKNNPIKHKIGNWKKKPKAEPIRFQFLDNSVFFELTIHKSIGHLSSFNQYSKTTEYIVGEIEKGKHSIILKSLLKYPGKNVIREHPNKYLDKSIIIFELDSSNTKIRDIKY